MGVVQDQVNQGDVSVSGGPQPPSQRRPLERRLHPHKV